MSYAIRVERFRSLKVLDKAESQVEAAEINGDNGEEIEDEEADAP